MADTTKAMEDVYFTPKEIAKHWKASLSKVYQLLQLGKLKAKRLGAIRVSKRDLLQYERIAALLKRKI